MTVLPDAKPSRRARWRRHVIAPAFLVTAWLGGFVWFAEVAVVYPPPASASTDAIVVLTGGRERVSTGLALLESGAAPRLFISGVHEEVTVGDLLDLNPGIVLDTPPPVSLGRAATSTEGNAAETAAWVAAEGVGSIRLVTSAYHMPRALSQFHRYLAGHPIIPHPVDSERVHMDEWWAWPGTASLLFSEYNKFLVAEAIAALEAIL